MNRQTVAVIGAGPAALAVAATLEQARRRGLYFVGFTNPLSGNLRELGIQARAIAKAVGEAA